MLKSAINSTAINARESLGSIAYLPDATATVETILFERYSPFMVGTTGMGLALAGDLSTVKILGTGTVALGLDLTGVLDKTQIVLLPSSTVGIQLEPTGALNTRLYQPYSGIATDIALTGSLTRTMYLSGVSNKDLSPTGLLVRQSLLPTASSTKLLTLDSLYFTNIVSLSGSIDKLMDATGTLTLGKVVFLSNAQAQTGFEMLGSLSGTFMLSGAAETSLDMVATLIAIRRLSGEASTDFLLDAYLSNNAFGVDIGSSTMVRRKTNREMTR